MLLMTTIHDLPTPALLFDIDALEHNLSTMAALRPGDLLRPHVKAHKCTALAAAQQAHGHRHFTCATPREVVGMAHAGVGASLLLANETVDPSRLASMAAVQGITDVIVAVDSAVTIEAAANAGIRAVVIDVNIGLHRCGCPPDDAGRLADHARRAGLDVRGVMGYEGHLMMLTDHDEQRAKVSASIDLLVAAHEQVGGSIVTSGGTGTFHVHDRVTDVQAGSYALMDSQYALHGHPFVQACHVLGTVISVAAGVDAGRFAVADVGLKALGMDHGNPSIDGARVWFCSDEHVTFGAGDAPLPGVGERVRVVPAHIDPTVAMHEAAWLVRDDEVVDRWPIDLRGW
jgi:D-threonine aldolase